MTIEIHRPELEALIIHRMQSGGFDNVEDVLMEALVAAGMVAETTRDRRTGADLITALQASPHRELEIEPERFRSSVPARDVKF